MLKAYEYRIYPSQEQIDFLRKTNGLCRLYWNLSLARKKEAFENKQPCKIVTAKQLFEEIRPEAREWMKEVDSTPFAATYMNITSAFNNFFKSTRGQRKTKVNEPRFKSKKKDKVSVTWSSAQPPKILKNGYLFITRKLGPIKGTFHRFAEGKFRHCTISETSTGKWFVKIVVDKKVEQKNKNNLCVGIDWNCRDDSFLTMSNGTKIKCPRFLKRKQKRLSKLQSTLSGRYKKGEEVQSNSYEKLKRKVAKLHEKVANQRKDWLHKLSRELCNTYETIFVEDINLQKMASELNHGKVVCDQGFCMLRTFISYKGELVKVRPEYTSKTCHTCGFINDEVVIGVNKWTCPICHTSHDRDVNAALNILHKGLVGRERAEIKNAKGKTLEISMASRSDSDLVNIEDHRSLACD